ncbi:hypothetical protein FRC01_004634 [Tulasnella sp. 417]|nr:hypothetical protein FRC01_004634 [Tulasnella sp. 417]
MADFAATYILHEALVWHSRLPEDVRQDWVKLEPALLDQWPIPKNDRELRIQPTPAAADEREKLQAPSLFRTASVWTVATPPSAPPPPGLAPSTVAAPQVPASSFPAAAPKRKLDANKFFQTPTSAPPAQPTQPFAPPPPTAPPPSSAVPPFHPNAANNSVAAANVTANNPSQRFSNLPPCSAPGYHPPRVPNQHPMGVGVPPPPHSRPFPPATSDPRGPSFNSGPSINGAGVPPPPAVPAIGASYGRGPQPAADQPTGTVPQVSNPSLGHQPPIMHQQAPGGPFPVPGQMPSQAPYPGQQMEMGRQQPPYGGRQPHQYPQYPYMNPGWYPPGQQPHMP